MQKWEYTAIAVFAVMIILVVLGVIFGYRKIRKDFGPRRDQ
jgi:MFS-type transporter involved in bile tolerance (Atg22 family)